MSDAAVKRVHVPPQTRREDLSETIHGQEVSDPYRWLEDGASAETCAWVAVQTEYTAPFLVTPERARLRARLAEIMKVNEVGAPVRRNGRYFFTRRAANQQHPVICQREGVDGPEEVLIDPSSMSTNNLISVEILDVSPSGTLLAYSVRRGGEDEHEIRVFDLASRRDLSDRLPKDRYYNNFSWSRDSTGFYYFVLTTEKSCVRFHRLGSALDSDKELFSTRPDWAISVHASDDGHYLMITVIRGAGGSSTEIYYQRLDDVAPLIPLVNDIDAVFFPAYAGDAIVLRTNWQAPNWRLIRVDLNNPGRARWREIVAEGSAPMQSHSAIGGKLLVTHLDDVHSRISVYEPDGSYIRDVNLPSSGTAGPISGTWQSAEAFFSFTSFNVPPMIYLYDVSVDALGIWSQQNVPADFDQFEFHQAWCESKDGTRVPLHVFHRKNLELNGASPTLLLGYGGFSESYTPFYWPPGLVWVEAGGVFAVANLRGGGEFGEQWHQAGMLENKQKVFDDFVAAAQWLISSRYTSSERLAIIGASNGGLLVGAALTQCPEIFRAAVCWAPLLDMIRYQRHPLGPFWIPEFGSSDDPTQFQYLYAYSPYHNVKKGIRYPAVMFVTGEADSRCDPMHARKMAAALQWASSSEERPIILHHRSAAGHMTSLAKDDTVDEAADQLSFLFRELGFQY
jgi:prolyl oligopeptidase